MLSKIKNFLFNKNKKSKEIKNDVFELSNNTFYINPVFFEKGNRTVFNKYYCKKNEKEDYTEYFLEKINWKKRSILKDQYMSFKFFKNARSVYSYANNQFVDPKKLKEYVSLAYNIRVPRDITKKEINAIKQILRNKYGIRNIYYADNNCNHRYYSNNTLNFYFYYYLDPKEISSILKDLDLNCFAITYME